MIVDSSALVAILQEEPGADRLARLCLDHPAAMSAATLVEVRVVIGSRSGELGLRRLSGLVSEFHIEIVPFDEAQADAASDAYRDFGRGSGHAARLNLGDTYSFALAYVRDEPLLYVGDDFTRTGIRSALEELDDLA